MRSVHLQPPEEWTSQGNVLSFVFPKRGAGTFISATVTQPLVVGDALILDGASGGRLCASDGGELIFCWFPVCFEHLFPLFASNEISLLQTVVDGFKGTRLYPASGTLACKCHQLLADIPPQFDLDHRGQLLRVVAAILSVEFQEAHQRPAGFVRPEEHMIHVFENLSTAEILGASIDKLAAKFGCSRRHLNRLFHHHFGVSVAALRMEMRLLKAASLLRNPDAKVINVAEECRFNHLGLFNTCFKRRFGISPGQSRKGTVPVENPPAALLHGDPACLMLVNGLCPWSGKSAGSRPVKPGASPAQKTDLKKPLPAAKGPPQAAGPRRGARPQPIRAKGNRRIAPHPLPKS